MRARTGISTKAQRQITLDDFRGVDFSSSPLRVNTSRATEMQNLICDFGVNRKRNGWRELMRFDEGKINGIFDCKTDNSYLVHAGTNIYRVDKSTGARTLLSTEAENQLSEAFSHYGELYILCGRFMVYREEGETYTLSNVSDSIAYIPTTTIYINKLDENGVPTGAPETHEPTNSLTRLRKNTLVGDVKNSTYNLDGKIDNKYAVKITAVLESGTVSITVPAGETDFEGEISGNLIIGDETSRITFQTDTTAHGGVDDNITVEYYASGESAVDVGKCTFGMKFGADGNTDRLFLGGHPDYPNQDFYSEQDNFLYFPPGNRTTFGTDNAKIMGYARLSDTTQVIYKEESPIESTIYYRTGTSRNVYDDSGNFVKIETVFPITAGGIGEGVISGKACRNFAGDVLMLSSNGVYGVAIGENVATSERYAKERSRSINARLTQHKLSSATAIVYKNRYYLSVDSVCYIADTRYKYVPDDNADGAYSYEWWYWTNIPARLFCEIDDSLYFGTVDGRVCLFDDEYTDRDTHLAKDGDFTVRINENACYYNPTGELHGISDGDTINISEDSDAVHILLLDDCTVKDGRICSLGENLRFIYEGMKIYVDNEGESGLSADTPYYITNIDRGEESCELTTEKYNGNSENLIYIKSGGFRISKRINGTPWIISGVDCERFGFYSLKDGELVKDTLIYYNLKTPTAATASFVHHTNVVAKWVTPIMDLGTNVMAKTLLKLTIAVEPDGGGPVVVGYETRVANAEITGKSMRGFSFDDMDFNNFTFETSFASSHTVRVKERNFNYIIFRFISDSKYPCAVHNLTATYKINKSNRGVS